jgi:predicted PurR-regulated permease PerM
MENEIKKKWYAPYVVAGLIWGAGTLFAKTLIGGELVLAIVAIATLFLYYPLKSKIKIKNELARVIVTFLIFYVVAALLVGFMGGLIDGLINKYSSDEKCQNLCNFSPGTNVWSFTYKEEVKSGPLYDKYGAGWMKPVTKYFQTQEQCLNYCLTQ